MKKYDLTQIEYREFPAISTSDIKQVLDNPYKFKIYPIIARIQSAW